MRDRKDSLEERLNAHPHLRDRIEKLLNIVEDAGGDLDKADEAERLVIEELRRLGHEALQDWAVKKESQKVEKLKSDKGRDITGHGKKNFIGTRRSDR